MKCHQCETAGMVEFNKMFLCSLCYERIILDEVNIKRVMAELRQPETVAALSTKELEMRVETLLLVLPACQRMIRPKGNWFYRGIPYDILPNRAKMLTYPDPDIVTVKAGRANYEGAPVFYGCDQQRGTFFETSPEPNKLLIVSEWEVIAPFVVTYLGQTSKVFKRFNAVRPVLPVPNLERYPVIRQEVNDFLDALFTMKNEEYQANAYKVSAAIAKQLMHPISYQGQNILFPSGIAYPTLAMRAGAINYAFPIKLADECLRLSGAHCYRVLDYNDQTFFYDFDFLSVMESNIDGDIKWREPTEEEKLRQHEICISSRPDRIYNPYQILRRLNISNLGVIETKDAL